MLEIAMTKTVIITIQNSKLNGMCSLICSYQNMCLISNKIFKPYEIT